MLQVQGAQEQSAGLEGLRQLLILTSIDPLILSDRVIQFGSVWMVELSYHHGHVPIAPSLTSWKSAVVDTIKGLSEAVDLSRY